MTAEFVARRELEAFLSATVDLRGGSDRPVEHLWLVWQGGLRCKWCGLDRDDERAISFLGPCEAQLWRPRRGAWRPFGE